jgi:hypothetical protein
MGELFNEALKTSQAGQAVSFQMTSAPWRPVEESYFDQRVFREPSLPASSPDVRDKAPGVSEELGQRLSQRDNLPLFLVMAGWLIGDPAVFVRPRQASEHGLQRAGRSHPRNRPRQRAGGPRQLLDWGSDVAHTSHYPQMEMGRLRTLRQEPDGGTPLIWVATGPAERAGSVGPRGAQKLNSDIRSLPAQGKRTSDKTGRNQAHVDAVTRFCMTLQYEEHTGLPIKTGVK